MTTFELAGQAMLQVQDGNRSLAKSLAQAVASLITRRPPHPDTLAGATFLQQEPALATEAKLPNHLRAL